MPIQTRYLFSAAMSVRAAKDALFNEVYDTEHVPALLGVPGVIAVARFKSEPVTMMIGGERRTIVIESEPAYNALYEIESPAVLTSDAWAKAVEDGRWAQHVRPYTTNRRHVIYRRRSYAVFCLKKKNAPAVPTAPEQPTWTPALPGRPPRHW